MPTIIKVICFSCKRPVGKIQERKNRAFCYPCWKGIFGRPKKDTAEKPKNRMMTPKEWIRRYRIQ